MNVGQVRPHDVTGKPVLIQRAAKESARGVSGGVDQADLSDSARDALHEVERQAARLKGADIERQRLTEAARQKVERGELDDAQVLRATAQRLLESES